jgi:hypothetical protein
MCLLHGNLGSIIFDFNFKDRLVSCITSRKAYLGASDALAGCHIKFGTVVGASYHLLAHQAQTSPYESQVPVSLLAH